MEKDDTKSLAAVRCAKAAMLLHSIKTRREQQEKEMKNRAIEELKMELVKERFKRRNLKACNLVEFSLLMVLLFAIFTIVFLNFWEVI
ncbi:hypothetical protein KSS87_008155 [Heliosperma pusillum]|nr:hypothetical protein KSS87_008155 [Heliosperma pusillum]